MSDPIKLNPRPTVTDLRPILQRIRDRQPHGWCCLYATLMMHPEARVCAQWSADMAKREGHADCLEAAEMLFRMTETQRRKAERILDTMKPTAAHPTGLSHTPAGG